MKLHRRLFKSPNLLFMRETPDDQFYLLSLYSPERLADRIAPDEMTTEIKSEIAKGRCKSGKKENRIVR